MNKKIFSVTAIIILFLYSCGYDIKNNYDMLLINKSRKEISLIYSNDTNVQTKNNVAYYLSEQSATQPDSSRIIFKIGGKNAWHDYIESGKAKRLYFYIFETDTLKKYNNVFSMYDLVMRRKFIRALSYSESELHKVHWKIIIN